MESPTAEMGSNPHQTIIHTTAATWNSIPRITLMVKTSSNKFVEMTDLISTHISTDYSCPGIPTLDLP